MSLPAATAVPTSPVNERRRKRRRTSSPSIPSTGDSLPAATAPKPPSVRKSLSHTPRTLYDAVAGRLTIHGHRKTPAYDHQLPTGDTPSHNLAPITPSEALSVRGNAPDFVEEEQLYNIHRRLSERTLNTASHNEESSVNLSRLQVGRLPSSDLLKALHAYSSDFYAATTKDKGRCDWRSLDETALLAAGVLLEEEVGRLLGANGWAAFVEQDDRKLADGTTNSSEHEQGTEVGIQSDDANDDGIDNGLGSDGTSETEPSESS